MSFDSAGADSIVIPDTVALQVGRMECPPLGASQDLGVSNTRELLLPRSCQSDLGKVNVDGHFRAGARICRPALDLL